MKRRIKMNYLIPAMLLFITSAAFSQSGEEIMRMADERYTGDSSSSRTTIQLINKRGNERVRELISYSRDYGDSEKTVMVFQRPADVKGVGYLSYSYEEMGKDDDTWLYLPALKKSRRISGSSRNDYFMGTDFTYDDMGDREVYEDSHTLVREEVLDGEKCWVIESRPLESGEMYSRRISWIRQDIHMAVKVEFYDRQQNLMKILTISDITQIDGIWTAGTMVMDNLLKEHKTILTMGDMRYNIEVDDNFFSVATLERGRIR